jgi:hypothetical protein
MPDYIPKPDSEAIVFFDRAIDALELTPANYGIVAADATALRTSLEAFDDSYNAAQDAENSRVAAVAEKNTARAAFEAAFRPLVQQLQVNPAVSDESKTVAGLPIRDLVRTISAPVAPVDLVAVEMSGGAHELAWLSNGNAPGVQYVVEAKTGLAGDFSLVDVVTTTTFRRSGQTPGVRVDYRVRARRRDQNSEPSNVASVFA